MDATLLLCPHNNTMSFSSLATELLQQIFDYLPIHDSRSVKDAYSHNQLHDKFKKIYGERISIVRYFNNYGIDGKSVMKILAESHAVVVGSRALEFFVPGYATGESDWNFYVPPSKYFQYHFFKSMESQGVEWQELYEVLYRQVIQKMGHMTLTNKNLSLCIHKLKTMDLDDWESAALHDIEESYQLLVDDVVGINDATILMLFYEDDDMVKVSTGPGRSERREYNRLTDAFGQWKLGRMTYSINISFGQYAISNHKSIMHTIPVSSHQCFISGFGAQHMYGIAASKNIAYRWENKMMLEDRLSPMNPEISSPFGQIINKLLNRRFVVQYRQVNDNLEPVIFQPYGQGSICIPHRDRFGWDEKYWLLMSRYALYHMWKEHLFKTREHMGYTRRDHKAVEYQNKFHIACPDEREKLIPYDESYMYRHGFI